MKDRLGNNITFKEFFQRWKQGINGITAVQQSSAVQWGHYILIIGIIWGLIYSFIQGFYWLSVIMIGTLIINIFGLIGVIQKHTFLKQMENAAKEMAEAPKPEYIA